LPTAFWPLWIVIATLTGCAFQPWQQEHVARVEVLALLQTLNADLLSHDSATLTLEHWCADHRLGEPARIVARLARDTFKPVPDELRSHLEIGAGESLKYRHVQLVCGARVLSEADNWYVPSRLTAEMNRRLDDSDEPFGKVVQALGFQRRTLSAQLLWSPLPRGWEMPAANVDRTLMRIPHAVLRHQAILHTSAHVPFSAVMETYTNQLFDFGTWATYRE
jgi:chorismate-pyruvate lyase